MYSWHRLPLKSAHARSINADPETSRVLLRCNGPFPTSISDRLKSEWPGFQRFAEVLPDPDKGRMQVTRPAEQTWSDRAGRSRQRRLNDRRAVASLQSQRHNFQLYNAPLTFAFFEGCRQLAHNDSFVPGRFISCYTCRIGRSEAGPAHMVLFLTALTPTGRNVQTWRGEEARSELVATDSGKFSISCQRRYYSKLKGIHDRFPLLLRSPSFTTNRLFSRTDGFNANASTRYSTTHSPFQTCSLKRIRSFSVGNCFSRAKGFRCAFVIR
jgi:hypothetical protein